MCIRDRVRDVLLSGGDCLMVSDENLEYIIKRLRAIPHVEIVRLGSRTDVYKRQGYCFAGDRHPLQTEQKGAARRKDNVGL